MGWITPCWPENYDAAAPPATSPTLNRVSFSEVGPVKATGPAPLRLLVGGFLALIAAGTALLLAPAATPRDEPIGLIDALFTATSATCVTGLIVRDTGAGFTGFGQAVILILIQLGGLGIMTFSLVVFSLFSSRLSMVSRSLVAQTVAGVGDWEDFWPLLRLVVRYTFAAEALGALLLFGRWERELGTAPAAWAAVFHSVSAFCNAGFGLRPDSLSQWRDDTFVNVVVISLIVLGGLGYLTVFELVETRRDRRRLSVHTRLALWTTSLLLAGGAALFWLLERQNTLAGLSGKTALLVSLFQSATCRTAGFNTVPVAGLGPQTLLLMMILMFIGGSPGSCAGGIKTTTFAVLVLTAWTRLRNRVHVNAFGRTLSLETIANTLSITLGGMAVMLLGLFVLLALESPEAQSADRSGVFVGYVFETVSALGTVGLSTGVTPLLTPAARLLITLLMFVGRLGPLTVAASLTRENPLTDWQHPEEDVMVG